MIIFDTGVLYALADRSDGHHAACVRWLAAASGPFVVPSPVVAETCYLVGEYLGPESEAVFLDGVGAGRALRLVELVDEDLRRMAALVRQYGDLPLGGTDAAVVAVAERLGVDRIATVDRRDFSVVRPRHVDAFVLLPERL